MLWYFIKDFCLVLTYGHHQTRMICWLSSTLSGFAEGGLLRFNKQKTKMIDHNESNLIIKISKIYVLDLSAFILCVLNESALNWTNKWAHRFSKKRFQLMVEVEEKEIWETNGALN